MSAYNVAMSELSTLAARIEDLALRTPNFTRLTVSPIQPIWKVDDPIIIQTKRAPKCTNKKTRKHNQCSLCCQVGHNLQMYRTTPSTSARSRKRHVLNVSDSRSEEQNERNTNSFPSHVPTTGTFRYGESSI